MSATIGKGPERSPGLQPFSYAEAAKGRTIPILSPQQLMDAPPKSPANPTEERRPSAHTIPITNGIESSQSTNIQEDTLEAVVTSHESEGLQSPSDHENTSTTASTVTSPALQTKTMQEPKRGTSGTSSPSFGTASTSTLPKEDDISFTPNGSSDSTWDKQSQVSNSAEKSTQTGETSEEKAPEGTWETTAAGFKELKAAPIPSVNIWAQRKAAQDAKAKGNVKPTPAPLSIRTSTKSGSPNLPPTVDDPTPDQIKPGSKKRGSVPAKSTEDGSTQQRQDRRRATDGGKPKDDGPKRAGARPSRSPPEKEKTTVESNPPPPVGDAESWPTPNLAQDGMKRKVSDRVDRNDSTEKDKSPGTRPHGKEKWVPVPYVPSAIFATPLPTGARRGGRGGGRGGREGGGRGGHASSNSIGGDKAGAGSMGPPPTPKSTSNERGRNEGSGGRATSLPAQSRRANSADAAPAADQRKTSQPIQQERSRGEARPSRNAEDLVPKSADSARFPNNVSEENGPKFRQESRAFSRANEGSNNGSNQRTYDPSMRHPSLPNSNDIHAHPRYEDGGRRSTSFVRPSDFQREPRESNSGIYPRERGEPRTERGRGSYRGTRGNFNGGNSQPRDSFSNTPQPQQTPPSFAPSKSHSYNDRPSYTDRGSQQTQSSSYSSLSQQPRTQRPNLRSQSIPTSGGYQQYPSPNGGQVAQIQTDVPPTYPYPPMYAGIMSAMPYQPYMADYSVISMVQMQMDYYFSVDNLCKDLYLRKHMDSQGFVPLHVIANFRRIKSLTDNLEVLRMVCRSLKSLELRAGEDGIDRVRKRDGWDQWILKMEDRDPSAQNDGPAEIFHQQHPQSPQGYVDGPDDVFSPAEQHNSRVGAGIAMSPTSMQAPFPEYPTPMIPTSPFDYMNGMMQNPLSHATPEFVPNFPPLSLNDVAARDAAPLQSFPEELVDDIMMVVKRQPGQVSSPSHQPNPGDRTLSQESISERTMEQNGSSGDGRQGLSLRGDNVRSNLNELSGFDGIQSPGSQESSRLMNGTPPNLWVKEGDIPAESLDDGEYHERYGTFKPRALAERQSAPYGESPWNMNHLYEFWSHFLVDVSSPRMYKEFRTVAIEDQSSRGSSDGMQYLVRFYGDTFRSPHVVLPEIAQDFIDVVKMESKDENRPAFRKLRSILRNGAFNLKSRKIIDNLLDSELKTELEK